MSAVLEMEASREIVPEILPDRYEIIDGNIVEIPPMSDLSNTVSSRLLLAIGTHAVKHKLGEAHMEFLFRMPAPIDRNRRPDVCFVSYERWPANRPITSRNARDVVPDLCVEVISPSDIHDDDHEKLIEYFDAGVKQVWVIHPRFGDVYVYDSRHRVRGYSADEVIEGSPCLPGLNFKLADVLPVMAKD